MIEKIEFRPLKTIVEKKNSFRLRYEIFTEIGYLQQSNKAGLDIDKYDIYSHHLGGFACHPDGTRKLIATIRITTDRIIDDSFSAVRYILNEMNEIVLTDCYIKSPNMKTLEDFVRLSKKEMVAAEAANLKTVLCQFSDKKLTFGEFSKVAVHPGYRKMTYPKLSHFLMLYCIAFLRESGFPRMIFGVCNPKLTGFYNQFGWFYTGIDGKIKDDFVNILLQDMNKELYNQKYENIINSILHLVEVHPLLSMSLSV